MDGHAQFPQSPHAWLNQHHAPPILASPSQVTGSLKRPRSSPPPALARQGGQGQGGQGADIDTAAAPDVQLPQPPPELFFSQHLLPLPVPPVQQQQQQQIHIGRPAQPPLVPGVGEKPIATNSRVQAALEQQHQAEPGLGPPAVGPVVGGAGGQDHHDHQQHQQQVGGSGAGAAVDGPAMPDRAEYDAAVESYVNALHPIKRNKALMSPSLHQLVLSILLEPQNTKQGDPQLRFWVRQRFNLQSSPEGDFVMHDSKKVVLRPNLFDTIAAAHAATNHGGRDKTYAAVKEAWSYVPKEVVTVFVKLCPTCNGKRVTVKGKRPKTEKRVPLPKDILNGPSDDAVPDTAAGMTATAAAAAAATAQAIAQAVVSDGPIAGPSGTVAPLPLPPFQTTVPQAYTPQQQPGPAPAPTPKVKAPHKPRQTKPKPNPAPPPFAAPLAQFAEDGSASAPVKRSGRKSAQAAAAGIRTLAAQEQEDDDDEYHVRKVDHDVKVSDLEADADGEDEGAGGGEATDEDAPGEPDEVALDGAAQGIPVDGYTAAAAAVDDAHRSAQALHALYHSE